MTLICDSTIGEGESIPPLTNFQKSWHIQNSGTETWPEGVCLQYIGGVQMGACTKVPVSSLGPAEITVISVDLQSPPYCGTFKSKWRMMVKSTETFFGGEFIYIIIIAYLYYCYYFNYNIINIYIYIYNYFNYKLIFNIINYFFI